MAFTSAEQNKIVQLLGYGGKVLQSGSVIYDKILVDRLANVPTDEETLVRAYLTQITAIETQMNAAICRLTTIQIDDIKLNNDEISMLRKERRKIAKEIAQHVDIPFIGTNGTNVGVLN